MLNLCFYIIFIFFAIHLPFTLYIATPIISLTLFKYLLSKSSTETNGGLYLDGLTSAEGLVLPKELNGDLCLGGLTSAKDLILPKELNGDLCLGALTSAKGLVLPEKINSDLYLIALKDLSTLTIPLDFECKCILTKNRYIYPHEFYKYQSQDTKEESQSKRK